MMDSTIRCTASGFGCSFFDGLSGLVAQRKQDSLGALGARGMQFVKRPPEGCHSKIFFALRPMHPVHESSQVDQLAASIHKIEVEDLWSRHTESVGREGAGVECRVT